VSRRPDEVDLWFEQHLGVRPLWRGQQTRGFLSRVETLQLPSGQRVVVKIRRLQERIWGCTDAQRLLAASGFPVPAVLAGPARLGLLVATAEPYIASGQIVSGGDRLASAHAAALAELVRCSPRPEQVRSLQPPPAWVWWDHDGVDVWPPVMTAGMISTLTRRRDGCEISRSALVLGFG